RRSISFPRPPVRPRPSSWCCRSSRGRCTASRCACRRPPCPSWTWCASWSGRGHALAHCQAVEALADVEVPARARYLRVVLLEMERLYNHVADFGMIANDTGFAAAHSHCFRIRERLLRLNKRLTGNRLLRGALVPGGNMRDFPADLDLVSELETVLADFNQIVEITLSNTLVADRLEGTGCLTTQTARDHGVLGFVARASGLDIDARRDHPFAAYAELAFRVPVFESG